MTNVNWDEATRSSGFVSLEEEKEKVLKLTNFELIQRPNDAKIAAGEIEFIADVLEEDGREVADLKFSTTSKRLKKKLRPIFENKTKADIVKISIMKIGDKFDTQYSVKEIKE